MSGETMLFIRSCDTAAAMTRSSPAAVESAAARPPAATSAMTQFGSFAISGLASTMMSRSTLTSFTFGSFAICMTPSPFLSSQPTSLVFSQFLNQEGASAYFVPWIVLMKLVRAKAATAGAVV